MNRYLKNFFAFCVGVLVCMPVWCTAATDPTIRIVEREGTAPTAASLYDVMLDTGSAVLNTLEAELQFTTTDAKVADILTGDSIMSLWIQPPAVQGQIIAFKAATAGGVSTNHGRLFTVALLPLAPSGGSVSFSMRSAKGYLNDGKGTPVPILLSPVTVRLPATSTATTSEHGVQALLATDVIPPSTLTASVARSESLYSNQWFVAFNARDSESGIARYEVQESLQETPVDGLWHPAVSPFVLTDQSRRSYVHVRAFDKAGNVTLRTIRPSPEISFAYTKYIFWCILCVAIFVVLRLVWKRKPKITHTPPPAPRV